MEDGREEAVAELQRILKKMDEEDDDDELLEFFRRGTILSLRYWCALHGVSGEKTAACLKVIQETERIVDPKDLGSLRLETEVGRKQYYDKVRTVLEKALDAETAQKAARYILAKEVDLDEEHVLPFYGIILNQVQRAEDKEKRGEICTGPVNWKPYFAILDAWIDPELWIDNVSAPDVVSTAEKIAKKAVMFDLGPSTPKAEWGSYMHVLLRTEIRKLLEELDWTSHPHVSEHVVQLLYEKACGEHGLVPCFGCE